MTSTNGSKIAQWAFLLFAFIVVAVNTAVTWQFGALYLRSAFNIVDPFTAAIFGGAYAVIMLDVGALVWLATYMRAAETTSQRALALVSAIISFSGSLVATAYMLSTNTAGVLATHATGVASAAQIGMILVVILHAVGASVYMLTAAGETVLQATIDARSTAVGKAVQQAKNDVQNEVPLLASMIGDVLKTQILAELGFTRESGGRLVYNPGDGQNLVELTPHSAHEPERPHETETTYTNGREPETATARPTAGGR